MLGTQQAQEENVTWFKVDDGFWSHPKTVDLSAGAVALWVRAGSYCGNHLTDGLVPRHILQMLQGTTEQAQELITAGLWLDHVDGYQFHDWLIYQPTRDRVERDRESSRARVAKHRANNDTSSKELKELTTYPTRPRKRVTNGVSNGVTFAEHFDQFWKAYPLKKNKAQARDKWNKAVEKIDPQTVIDGAVRYAQDPNRVLEFTKHAATWLHNESWEDDPEPPRGPQTAEQRKMVATKELLDWAASEDRRELGA